MVGSFACAALLILFIITMADTPQSLRLEDLWVTVALILPFEALGLILLLPIALFVCKQSLPFALTAAAVTLVGAGIGPAIGLPLSNAPMHQDLALPATFGALSAAIWLSLNGDAVQGQVPRRVKGELKP